jgi:predicted Fe-Mo cluster-binding NifX family protein
MKIAAVSDDGVTISQHFGRAKWYVVVTVEDGAIVSREQRDKMGHHTFARESHHDHDHEHGHAHTHDHTHAHGHDESHTADPRGHGFAPHAHNRHERMAAAISDCNALLVRGMGAGAYQSMQAIGIRPIVTSIASVDEAVMAYVEGKIVDHTERLH